MLASICTSTTGSDVDFLIAATALVHDLVLVTGNEDHFERVPGLRFANWRTA